jgi:hypothetical protein
MGVLSLSNMRAGSLLWLLVAAINSFAEPVVFHAEYEAKAYGFSAEASRSLSRISDNLYALQSTIEAKLFGESLARLNERSEFRWQDGQVLPQSYSYIQSGVSSSTEQVAFDWTSNIAISTEDDESWQIPIKQGVLDKLAYQLQIRELIKQAAASEFNFQVLDTDEIKEHHYRIVGEQVLETELGSLNTVRVEKVREDSDSRSTIIWLASDWDYLLVRLEQVNGSGRTVELILQSATVNGEVVSALQ